MLNHRPCPVGIDYGIVKMQKDLFVALENLGWTNYTSFDRVYKNKKGSDKIPEVYLGNGEYKECLYNDNETVTSFFIADEKRTYDYQNALWTQDIGFIVQANLTTLYPNVTNQPDEEMITTIRKAIKSTYWDNRMIEIVTGFEKIYDSLKINYSKKDFADMGNYGLARFNFRMYYTNAEKIIFIK